MSGPLQGIRIIDLTTVISGPMATMILADQGAEVIKVERADGDYTRQLATRRGDFSASFLNNNRNKKSLVLDLKNLKDLDALKQLIKTSDVFVQNFRPGVAIRLGLGYEDLKKLNTKLVYMSIAGFGFSGPLASKPVYDPLIQAVSALTTVQAGSDEDRPKLVRTILPDKITGIQASQAITAALLSRERNGEGQEVTLSMLDTMASFLWSSDMNGHTFVGDEMEVEEAQSFADLVYDVADGFLSISVMQDKHWEGVARATSRLDILDDARFSNAENREVYKNERLTLTQAIVSDFKRDELIEKLEREGVPCAPVLTRTEMRQHPQIEANQTLIEYEHPIAGRLRQSRAPAVFLGTPTGEVTPAPSLGQHTEEILTQLNSNYTHD